MADDVKTVDARPNVQVDEKGVPLENRVKEAERKLGEKYEKELAAVRAELEAMKNHVPQTQEDIKPVANAEEMTKAELMRFVSNPKAYVTEAFAEQETQREMTRVRPWLEGQEGYSRADDSRLMAIENEYQLGHPSPLARARAAWDILRKERMAENLQSKAEDSDRETTVTKTMAEGVGKTTNKSAGPKRADLIKQLKESESRGDFMRSTELLDRLEDVRE